MPNRRPSRLVPSFESFELRLNLSGGSVTTEQLLAPFQQLGHDQLTAIMQLLHQVAMEQRKTAGEAREAARDLQHEGIQAKVDRMREAAEFAHAAGSVSGIVSIAGGAGSIKGVSHERVSSVRDALELSHKPMILQDIAKLEQKPPLDREAERLEPDPTELHDQALAEFQERVNAMINQVHEQLARLQEAQQRMLAIIGRF